MKAGLRAGFEGLGKMGREGKGRGEPDLLWEARRVCVCVVSG